MYECYLKANRVLYCVYIQNSALLALSKYLWLTKVDVQLSQRCFAELSCRNLEGLIADVLL